MATLKKTANVRRDKANKAVRSYFDAAARPAAAKRAARSKAAAAEAVATTPERADAFVEENRAAFNLKDVELRRDLVKEGAASTSVRYEQRHHGVPVYGAQLVVGLPKTGGEPTSAVNKVDYDLPADLRPEDVNLYAYRGESPAPRHAPTSRARSRPASKPRPRWARASRAVRTWPTGSKRTPATRRASRWANGKSWWTRSAARSLP